MPFYLEEVHDNRQRIREFLDFPARLYKGEPQWIRPLDKDIEAVFDPKSNKYFRNGDAIRWLLRDDANRVVGRVAAFYNLKMASKGNKQPTGGLGFFECIDDQEAANTLFDACKNWLADKGMEAMDGPINFGDRDQFWGLQIDGFQYPPNYKMFFHFPYYQKLFENYGFQIYFKQFTFRRKVLAPLPPLLEEKAQRIFQNPDYSFCHIEKKRLDKFTEDFRTIFNRAWVNHKGVPEMTAAQARLRMKQLKPILDENIIFYAYYKDEPIGFFIMIPELNEYFKHVNGKFDWWAKLKIFYHQKMGHCRKMFGIVFGVVPEHQGKGLDAGLIKASGYQVQREKSPYRFFEMNWLGDFNPKMIRVAEQIDSQLAKTHATYRYLFDRNQPFERMRGIH